MLYKSALPRLDGITGHLNLGGSTAFVTGKPGTMKKPKTVKAAKVQKIIRSPDPRDPEKAEIAVEGADHLYKEIRIENRLKDEKGNEVKLKEGAKVEVVVEADADAIAPTTSGGQEK